MVQINSLPSSHDNSTTHVEYPLHEAAKNGDLQQVQALISSSLNIDAYDPVTQGTPLCWAASQNHLEVARALLKAGADPNALIRQGGTPLYLATLLGEEEMVQLLLQYNASSNTPNIFPTGHVQTALNVAAKMGWREIAILLVQHEADIQMALRIAESDGSKAEAIQFLCSLESK